MIDYPDQLNMYLFGAPRLVQAGREVHLRRRKMYGLLAYLAFGKRQFHRDTLAALLWPDHDEVHSHGSLRVVLSEIHKTIGPDILPVRDELVGPLDLKRISVDIEEFQAVMARIRLNQRLGADQSLKEIPSGEEKSVESNRELLQEAVHLYQGDFMSGFTLGECNQFSDWQFQQGEYLRREQCYALERLVDICEQEGEYEEGIAHCRRFVEVDYLNEEAHCALMRLYAANGQREAALHQFRLCEKALQEELGLGPEESTVELYQSIRHSRSVRITATARMGQVKPRLAVLPFKSLADEQEWFSDGMTDALITELSRREWLEVISYTSSRRFQHTEKSLRQVASELDVDHLLEGTVLRAGNDVRISAQLVEAVGDRLVWAESYRGSFSSILELQEKIARAITIQVMGELVPERETPAPREILPEAREACLMGDYYLRKSDSDEGIDKAREYYQEAANRDPTFADAFAGLAFTYFSLGGYGRDVVPTKESRTIIRQFIQQALRIDPENVLARMVLAGSLMEWDGDWAGAEREFKEVLRINPQHIETLNWYSELKMCFGQFDEVFTLVQNAYRLNPLDMVTLIHLYRYYRCTLQYRRGLEILSRIDELFPGRSTTSFHRSWVYMLLGRYETAIKNGEKALAVQPHFDLYRGFLSFTYGKAGQKKKALHMIAEMVKDRDNQEGIEACWIGLAYHGVGMDDEALQWLEQSYQDHEPYIMGVAVRPLWGELHWDPRYQDIVHRVGVPLQLEYIRKTLEKQG